MSEFPDGFDLNGLKKGADMKIVNNIGDTVLHKASQHNSIQCAKHLVAKGIDINVLDKMKKTGNIPSLLSIPRILSLWSS